MEGCDGASSPDSRYGREIATISSELRPTSGVQAAGHLRIRARPSSAFTPDPAYGASGAGSDDFPACGSSLT
jgi:hypothetical protein